MKTISRYIMTLALLITAVTGAWAQWTGGTYTATGNEKLNTINVSDDATLTINQGVTVTVTSGIVVADGKTLTITGGGTLVAYGAEGDLGGFGQTGTPGGTAIAGNVIINGVGLTVTATGGNGGNGGKGGYGSNGGSYGETGGKGGNGGDGGNGGSAFSGAVTIYAGSVTATGGQGSRGGFGGLGGQGGEDGNGGDGGDGGNGGNGGYAFAGTLTVYGGNVSAYGGDGGYPGDGGQGGFPGDDNGNPGNPGNPGFMLGEVGRAYANSVTFEVATYTVKDNNGDNIPNSSITSHKEVIIESADAEPASDPVEVTTNAAEEGATFTEASFEMPTFDATAEYELVRDMGYKVAFSGVPTRARLAKDGDGKFHFADGLTFQLLDNIDAANPKDITSAEGITFMVGEVEAVDFEGNTFYQLNKETLVPLADFLADAHLGNYAICAVASTGEYDGSFSSGMITLFQGYEVTVPAGEYATYYRTDDNLKIDGENTGGKLYTITGVSGSTATATEITSANKAMPFLIYNGNTEAQTFLLIPTEETADNVTAYAGFVGTLEATEIAASTSTQTNYAFNGKQFVYVKNAIEVGANKCWLAIPTGVTSNAREINLVFGNTTGIESIDNSELTIDGWYDLNGRKLQGKPTKKGIYIHNGKKVVVK